MSGRHPLDDQAVLVCQRLAQAFGLTTFAAALRTGGEWEGRPTIGIEVEVPFSSYFPHLWNNFRLNERGVRDMDTHELHALSRECAAAEQPLRHRLTLTTECGVPRGADRYWEFSLAPVTNIRLLAEQVRLLTAAGVLPRDRRHSLHVTIGGLKASRDLYTLLGIVEVLHVEPERIRQGVDKTRSPIHSGWGRKGRSGLAEKGAGDLVAGAAHAVEFRTLQLPEGQEELLHLLELAQGCAHAILVGQKSQWASRWRALSSAFRAQLQEHDLPDANWWTSGPGGGVDFPAWERFVGAFPAIQRALPYPWQPHCGAAGPAQSLRARAH